MRLAVGSSLTVKSISLVIVLPIVGALLLTFSSVVFARTNSVDGGIISTTSNPIDPQPSTTSTGIDGDNSVPASSSNTENYNTLSSQSNSTSTTAEPPNTQTQPASPTLSVPANVQAKIIRQNATTQYVQSPSEPTILPVVDIQPPAPIDIAQVSTETTVTENTTQTFSNHKTHISKKSVAWPNVLFMLTCILALVSIIFLVKKYHTVMMRFARNIYSGIVSFLAVRIDAIDQFMIAALHIPKQFLSYSYMHGSILDLRKFPVPIGLFDGSEPVLAEGEVAIATSKEVRAGVARQNELGVLGALRKSSIFWAGQVVRLDDDWQDGSWQPTMNRPVATTDLAGKIVPPLAILSPGYESDDVEILTNDIDHNYEPRFAQQSFKKRATPNFNRREILYTAHSPALDSRNVSSGIRTLIK